MKWLTIFLAGILFALGLGISGMTQPEKVIGFLDIAGNWDPSLAFVMGGAVGINIILYRLILRRRRPVFDKTFTMPRQRNIGGRLISGAALFGIGWGLAGYCPGPALTSGVTASSSALLFIVAMLGGMLAFHVTQSEHEDDDVRNRIPPGDRKPADRQKIASAATPVRHI